MDDILLKLECGINSNSKALDWIDDLLTLKSVNAVSLTILIQSLNQVCCSQDYTEEQLIALCKSLSMLLAADQNPSVQQEIVNIVVNLPELLPSKHIATFFKIIYRGIVQQQKPFSSKVLTMLLDFISITVRKHATELISCVPETFTVIIYFYSILHCSEQENFSKTAYYLKEVWPINVYYNALFTVASTNVYLADSFFKILKNDPELTSNIEPKLNIDLRLLQLIGEVRFRYLYYSDNTIFKSAARTFLDIFSILIPENRLLTLIDNSSFRKHLANVVITLISLDSSNINAKLKTLLPQDVLINLSEDIHQLIMQKDYLEKLFDSEDNSLQTFHSMQTSMMKRILVFCNLLMDDSLFKELFMRLHREKQYCSKLSSSSLNRITKILCEMTKNEVYQVPELARYFAFLVHQNGESNSSLFRIYIALLFTQLPTNEQSLLTLYINDGSIFEFQTFDFKWFEDESDRKIILSSEQCDRLRKAAGLIKTIGSNVVKSSELLILRILQLTDCSAIVKSFEVKDLRQLISNVYLNNEIMLELFCCINPNTDSAIQVRLLISLLANQIDFMKLAGEQQAAELNYVVMLAHSIIVQMPYSLLRNSQEFQYTLYCWSTSLVSQLTLLDRSSLHTLCSIYLILWTQYLRKIVFMNIDLDSRKCSFFEALLSLTLSQPNHLSDDNKFFIAPNNYGASAEQIIKSSLSWPEVSHLAAIFVEKLISHTLTGEIDFSSVPVLHLFALSKQLKSKDAIIEFPAIQMEYICCRLQEAIFKIAKQYSDELKESELFSYFGMFQSSLDQVVYLEMRNAKPFLSIIISYFESLLQNQSIWSDRVLDLWRYLIKLTHNCVENIVSGLASLDHVFFVNELEQIMNCILNASLPESFYCTDELRRFFVLLKNLSSKNLLDIYLSSPNVTRVRSQLVYEKSDEEFVSLFERTLSAQVKSNLLVCLRHTSALISCTDSRLSDEFFFEIIRTIFERGYGVDIFTLFDFFGGLIKHSGLDLKQFISYIAADEVWIKKLAQWLECASILCDNNQYFSLKERQLLRRRTKLVLETIFAVDAKKLHHCISQSHKLVSRIERECGRELLDRLIYTILIESQVENSLDLCLSRFFDPLFVSFAEMSHILSIDAKGEVWRANMRKALARLSDLSNSFGLSWSIFIRAYIGVTEIDVLSDLGCIREKSKRWVLLIDLMSVKQEVKFFSLLKSSKITQSYCAIFEALMFVIVTAMKRIRPLYELALGLYKKLIHFLGVSGLAYEVKFCCEKRCSNIYGLAFVAACMIYYTFDLVDISVSYALNRLASDSNEKQLIYKRLKRFSKMVKCNFGAISAANSVELCNAREAFSRIN